MGPDSRLSDLSAVCVVPLYQTLVSRIDPGLYLESELPATHTHTHKHEEGISEVVNK